MIIRTYKHKNKIICYITENQNGTFNVCTGKPSDASCLSWQYKTIYEAMATATEYMANYLESINFWKEGTQT